jgi:hypothetical protein
MHKTIAALSTIALTCALAGVATAAPGHRHREDGHGHGQVDVDILSPRPGDRAGTAGAGWFVDVKVGFRDLSAAATGFTGTQLTGPAGHNNVPPFPGTFSPGADDHLPGLVVLSSTTSSTQPGFSGPGTNLANLFNLTGVTDHSRDGFEVQDTWVVGGPLFGTDVDSTITVAVVKDLDHDGVLDDAPAVVPDLNQDGRVDRRDLERLGVASHVETVTFHIV